MSNATVGNLSVEIGVSDEQLKSGLSQAINAAKDAGKKMQDGLLPDYSQKLEQNMQGLAVRFRQMQEKESVAFAKYNQSLDNNMQALSAKFRQMQADEAAAFQSYNQSLDNNMQGLVNKHRMQQDSGEGDSRKARSRAILDIGRSVQDFSAAGLMGVVNNVEGVASNVARAMGKSSDAAAALAGKLTLVAVAAQVGLPLVKSLIDSIASGLGLATTNAEKAAMSVKGMASGGLGFSARAEAKKADVDFLLARDDTPSKWNALSRAVGLSADAAEATARNLDRSVRATAAMSESMELQAKAAVESRRLQRGSTAFSDKTTDQQDQERINKELYQTAVDKYGGGENLRYKLETEGRRRGMNKTDARTLYGGFAEGDTASTNQVLSMLDLASEKAKLMAEDFDRATGAADELAKIEYEAAQEAERAFDREVESIFKGIAEAADKHAETVKARNKSIGREFDQMVKDELERQGLQKQEADIRANIDQMNSQRYRTEIIGGADAFMRNFTAGTSEDPVVKAIDKQTEELSQVLERLKELN